MYLYMVMFRLVIMLLLFFLAIIYLTTHFSSCSFCNSSVYINRFVVSTSIDTHNLIIFGTFISVIHF